MGGQIILAVDDQGRFLEYIPKEEGHKGKGRRHLAICVLLFNSKGQVLLQKRKHQIFDNLWDLTGATHPLHKPHSSCHSERLAKNPDLIGIATSLTSFVPRNDKKCKICSQDDVDETLEEATWRCLEEEWDISPSTSPATGVASLRVKEIGVFNYFAPYRTAQGDFCENEHCVMMVGKYDGKVSLNPEMGYEYKWMDKEEFLKDISQNSQNYTPWAVKGAKILQR